MPIVAPHTMTDPLDALIAQAIARTGNRPIPLLSTAFDVTLEGGLALVATRRVFRNVETASIEATITFPVPVHATLFALEARIDGRLLKARAEQRRAARVSYEDALDRGKSALLHEEVLRGVHMLSVGHIPPGAEIEVTSSWVTTLAWLGTRAHLRIPLTVGDIYGRSSLPEADDLLHGGPTGVADLAVHCRNGVPSLAGGTLDTGRAQVALDRPIDLFVTDASQQTLHGKAADGREVVMSIKPQASADRALDVALLLDGSGSMGSASSSRGQGRTKHQAMVDGLLASAERLGEADAIDLWGFNDTLRHVGSTGSGSRPGRALSALLDRLAPPQGGTEIGQALTGVIAQSTARDLLLVTDGKSHALDVQKLAGSGRRIAVVLVGEDSLEANVGHLASLTGGDVFVAADDLDEVLVAALVSLRVPGAPPAKIAGRLEQIEVVRNGAVVDARWRDTAQPLEDTPLARAVAALAASLAVPALDVEAATVLAEREGLVTHLTSLVLVDEAGATQETVPAMRKIALPTPAATLASPMAGPPPDVARAARAQAQAQVEASARDAAAASASAGRPTAAGRRPDPTPGSRPGPRLRDVITGLIRRPVGFDKPGRPDASPITPRRLIDWDADPAALQAGDLSVLDVEVAKTIRLAAARPEVVAFASRFGIDPVKLVLALLARSQAAANRSARRLARAMLAGVPEGQLETLARRLGFSAP
jgi:hypothetical protein